MLSLIMAANLYLALMFMFLKHPLSMGSILLVQTILSSLLVGNLSLNFWFSYMLFLIMVGGMLVLFIYMTSIASNEKFKINYMMIASSSFVPAVGVTLMKLMPMNEQINNLESYPQTETIVFNQLLTKFLSWPSYVTMMFMIVYLLITLIAVVKITEVLSGPLRTTN